MIYSVDLDEMAGRISYVDLCKYVSDLNWIKFSGKVREGIAIYQKTISKELFQITIPCDRNFSDYAFAIRKAIGTLSFTESKSEEQLILELLNPLSDILRVRHISSNVENGSILFEDAINLYDNAKKMLTNAALDVTNYKRIYKGRITDSVQQFISKCRYGQTEIGSYVISLVCPFVSIDDSGKAQQLSIFSDESNAAISLTRRATKKVMDSVCIIKNTIERGEDLSEVVEDESQQISVSFIESLTNLNLAIPGSALEIKAKWAPTIHENVSQSNIVEISHDYYSPLQSVIEKYKADDEKESYIIEGKIADLKAPPQLEKRTKGNAKLVYIADDSSRTKSITLVLDPDNYNVAIRAHQEGKTIRAVGKKNGTRMIDVSIIVL